MSARCSRLLVLAATLAGAVPAAAQTKLVLKDMPAVRGLEVQGRGGLSGPPLAPVAGALGQSSALVDLDGDGFDDLVVGAPSLPTIPALGVLDDAGHCTVIFGAAGDGQPGSSGDFNTGSFATGAAVDFVGDPGDRLGAAVAPAGDLDGDGRQDVLIGAPGRTFAGRVAAGGCYVVFGRADFKTLAKGLSLSVLAAGSSQRAVFLGGARAFGTAGSALSGDVDANNDGRGDVAIGAPLDSTSALTQNGTATVYYGQVGIAGLHSIDLAALGAGQVTVVHGTSDFQFLGFSVAGVGRFDPVLPMTNNLQNVLFGDDVAIGAPGTLVSGKLFAGAVYVLRGVASGTPAASYTASDFGSGPSTAGITYTGKDAGDQAGSWVAPAGDLIYDGQGYDDLIIGAPFNDGLGKADCGSIYVLAGNYLGLGPFGYDLGQLGHGDPTILGIHIQGAATGNGSLGVYATAAGDWNGDGLTDLLTGFPNATHVSGNTAYPGAGRARILDGAVVLFSLGTVDLSSTTAGYTLMQFDGEAAGAHAGAGLSQGDLNGDGAPDVSVGAPGAPSDPHPADTTGLANTRTGRAHVVYGPELRVASVTPSVSHYGGPTVTLSALSVPAGAVQVKLDGQEAVTLAVVPGDVGTITFAPPPPVAFGSLADLFVNCSAGKMTLPDALQYTIMSVSSGPTPATALAGGTVSFTGQAFSTLADMQVTMGGVPATVTAVDGLAGTLSATVPLGLPPGVPVDVVLDSSNGHVELPGALTVTPIVVTGVSPGNGPQTSGVFAPGATPYEGQPFVTANVSLATASGTLAGDLVIQFGTDALGWHTAPIVSTAGLVATVDVPHHLLGPVDTVVGVRAQSGGQTGVLPGSFTYLASDFREVGQYGQAGFGASAPVALAAGAVKNSAPMLLLLDDLPPQNQVAILFVGLGLIDPPLHLKGGLMPIDLGLPFFVYYLPFPGAPTIPVSLIIPPTIIPSADGVKLYLQCLTKETQTGETRFGFTNVLELTIHAGP